jgi:hypothetical protein
LRSRVGRYGGPNTEQGLLAPKGEQALLHQNRQPAAIPIFDQSGP